MFCTCVATSSARELMKKLNHFKYLKNNCPYYLDSTGIFIVPELQSDITEADLEILAAKFQATNNRWYESPSIQNELTSLRAMQGMTTNPEYIEKQIEELQAGLIVQTMVVNFTRMLE